MEEIEEFLFMEDELSWDFCDCWCNCSQFLKLDNVDGICDACFDDVHEGDPHF